MVFQPAGLPQTTTIPSMPTGLVFNMYNSYGRDISPGIGARCIDAPKSCNFATSGYPGSGSWDLGALDWSQQQQNFTWHCSAPKRVHQICNATTSYPLDKQNGGDTYYDVEFNILHPDGNNIGGTTLNVSQPSDNDYKDHSNMQFFSFGTPLITLRIGWDITDGGGHADFYFAYGENDYQTDGLGTEDEAKGIATTNTVFDCYYDDLDKPWLGP